MDASSNSLPPEDLSKRGVARCREKEHARVTQSSSSRGTVGRVPCISAATWKIPVIPTCNLYCETRIRRWRVCDLMSLSFVYVVG